MRFVLLAVLLQLYWNRAIVDVEDARLDQPAELLSALESSDVQVQRLAVRALGRYERNQFAASIRPLLSSSDAGVRMETINALAQMNVSFEIAKALESEKDGGVRSVIYESAGRLRDASPDAETILVNGLKDPLVNARAGAAKGLESLFRTHPDMKPSTATIAALRQAIRDNGDATLRELAMLTLNAAGDEDPETLALVLDDPEPQVRRLGVIASKRWKDDPSYIVRYEALKSAPTCDRAAALVRDPSDHVALLAIDLLGNGCSARLIERIVDSDKDWRKQAHAIVSLAKVDPESARKRLAKIADHEVSGPNVRGGSRQNHQRRSNRGQAQQRQSAQCDDCRNGYAARCGARSRESQLRACLRSGEEAERLGRGPPGSFRVACGPGPDHP